MTVIIDTAKLPAPRREEALHQALASGAAPMKVTFPCPADQVNIRLRHWQLGSACMFRCAGSGLGLSRTSRQVGKDPEPLVTFSFQVQGRGLHLHNGFTRRDAPGDVALLDFTLPWQVGFQSGVRGSFITSADDLGFPVDVIRRAVRSLAGSPVHDLFFGHLADLSRTPGTAADPEQAASLGRATTDLARALIASATQDDLDLAGDETWQETLLTRVSVFVRQNLTDPELCAEQIARAHNISVRHLYKLWSGHELSLGQWIMRERLEGARRDLTGQQATPATIATVAHRWGFADSTHFSRRFREAYALSPREWRQLHRPHLGPTG